MQNSRVIRRVNAGLSRCLSHHRRLCREIDKLDRLLFNDEFLQDPRTLWLLQTSQKESLNVDLADSSESEFKSFKCRCPNRKVKQIPGSLDEPEDCYQPSPARLSRPRPRPMRR
ncbi:uncharacterized protein [Drosophila kikkawai]|uniref:Uncharacterized protein isoform X2 n=1 Tax=Drosophila kikkawai TaxID=30033 RepID=A0A6P4JGD5_DROKI|nr:uncharacterized protein LOC108083387 isoform X2 [Drosophila kikkawai]